MAVVSLKKLLAFEALVLAAANAAPCGVLSFNSTVHGRLHVNTPFALPCFSNYNGVDVMPDAAACAAVQASYTNPLVRSNTPGAYMNNQDEACPSDPSDQCLLDSSSPTNPLAYTNKTCSQGQVPSYYLEVTSPQDVQAAITYATRHKVPLSIKNSGHDYLSRSGQKGAIALWMRNLKTLSYSDKFVPEGCPEATGTSYRAITSGAGVSMDEAYAFANEKNVTIIGGYAPTIGLNGGFLQAAGHSILSPVYGLAIDRVLEFKVVTPDGIYRTANKYTNPDLFWALRGGGGGTFGVVMEATHLVDAAVTFVAASISFPSNSTNLLPFYDLCINDTLKWAAEGWGGHLSGASLINVTPLLSLEQARESLAPIVAYAQAQGGKAVFEVHYSWYSFYQKYVSANSVAVGSTRLTGSQLIPKSVFEDPATKAQLLDYVKTLIKSGLSPYVPIVAPFLFDYEPGTTSTTPAWREAVWSLGAGASWAYNAPLDKRQAAVATHMNLQNQLAKLTGASSYMNEASPMLSNWRQAWWGDNYNPLLAIKKKYDPFGVLNCYKCVGWEESQSSCWSAFL